MAQSGQPPVDIVDFANRYNDLLNRVIGNRMRQVGVPNEMIGFKYPGIDEGPFVRYPTSQIGGNINPHVFPGRKPGINLDLGVLDASRPEVLIYEASDGGLQLVGVEFVVIAATWLASHSSPPVLEGQSFQFVDSPNRYGLPAHFELHVWAWRENPNGAFVDWNNKVSCEGK
jgi:hypothetical protein